MQLSRQHNNLWALLSAVLTGILGVGCLYFYFTMHLPDVSRLAEVPLQAPLTVYSREGQLIALFGEQRRMPVPYHAVPRQMIQAILATEDRRFFEHAGVDFFGLIRAARELLLTGRKTQGASTITMQVARNFFLSREKTYWRKLNEILLALDIDRHLSKQAILELYLNKIYFGHRAYGVQAASRIYYDRNLNQLNLAQMAMLAGLPKAPSRNNPLSNPEAALKRRNHVLGRMLDNQMIDQATYEAARAAPITAAYHGIKTDLPAPFVAEEVRRQMVAKYGARAYTEGLQVYTTVDARLQRHAQAIVENGVLAYDKRHGYRGPEAQLGFADEAQVIAALAKYAPVNGLLPGVVRNIQDQSIEVQLADGRLETVPWSGLSWARRVQTGGELGPRPQQAVDVVAVGDIVRVQADEKQAAPSWRLAQLPEVQAALVALDPHSGAIRALRGGFSFSASHFNRATQAWRQPGSALKPFIYAAALAQGYTLASILNDAPIVLADSGENRLWRPHNSSYAFHGPTSLRDALVYSRNLASIRLVQQLGVASVLAYLQRFGFDGDKQPKSLSLALGAGLVTPMQMAASYAVFANGGYQVQPYLIDYVLDAHGHRIEHSSSCLSGNTCIEQNKPAKIPEVAEVERDSLSAERLVQVEGQAKRVMTSDLAFLLDDVLRDVIARGTGRRAKVLNRPDIAGKTGTTNDKLDAWFVGYDHQLVTTVWLGFDQPKPLHEYGSQLALPLWIDFMRVALAGHPIYQADMPKNLVRVRIDPRTGQRLADTASAGIWEYFRSDHVPEAGEAAPPQDATPALALQNNTMPDTQADAPLF